MPLTNKDTFFEKVLEHMQSDVAILDPEGRYVYVNPYAVADPVIRAWIVGKTDLEYCMFRGIGVEVAHQRRDRFKQVTESRKAIEWEERMTDNEGVTRIFLRRLFPVFSEDGQRIACLIGNGIEITERRKAREELEANKRFTEAVLNNSPHLIFVKDKSGRFLLANKAVAELFNIPKDGIRMKNNYDLHSNSAEVDGYSKNDQQVFEKGHILRIEEPFTKSNGERLWFDTVKVPLIEADGTVNLLGISTDVTERKVKEDLLRISEQQLAEAQKLTKSGNWIRHLKDDKVEWSVGMYLIWERSEAAGPPSLDEVMNTISEEEGLMIYEKVAEIIEQVKEGDFNYKLQLPSGEKIVRTIAKPVLDDSGKVVAVFGSVIDITEQVRSEQNLQLNERRLNEAQLLGKMGDYELDVVKNTIRYSRACYAIYEWDPAVPVTDPTEFSKMLHPDDQQTLQELWKELSSRRADFIWETRIITGSGKVKFLRIVNSPVFNDAGDIVTVFGTITDITDQKMAEELFRYNEQRLNEAQKMAKTGSFSMNLSTGEITWSKGMYLIWELEETLKPDIDIFYKYLHPEDIDRIRSVEAGITINSLPWTLQYRIVTPSGKVKYLEVDSQISEDPVHAVKVLVGSCIDVTERMLNEQRLRLNEQRLFEAQELSHSGSWEVTILPEFSSVWSPGMYKMWDLDPEDAIPQSEEFYNCVSVEDRELVRSAFGKLVSSGDTIQVQYKVITRLNNEKVFFTNGKAIKDTLGRVEKIYGTNTDITISKATEEKLRRSEQSLLQAQKIAKLGSWHFDMRNHQMVWTEGMYHIWERDLNLPSPDLAEIRSTIHPDDIEQFEEAMMMTKTTIEEEILEFRIMLPQGNLKHVEGRGRVMRDEKGVPFMLFGTVIDINERKLVEDELIRARVQAEESSKAKEYFLANISHELRTPLNGILGMSRLLQKSVLSTTQREYMDVLHQTAENLLVIINDVLDFAKIDAGKLSLEEIIFDPARVSDTAINLQLFKAEEKDISLRHLHEGSAPLPLVMGDPYRLNQILLNLLNNAIKFTNSGEVVLTHKVMEESEHHIKILFSVKDTGIGIPVHLQSQIFESFTQADPFNMQQGGVGLGLTISKSLVERQGGNIWVESEPDVGSNFQFYITYKKADGKSLSVTEKQLEVINLGTLHLLLAEDNKVNLFITEAMLRDWGFKVDIAMNGEEAVELARNNNYDLILMDIQMPVKNGLEATREIRQFKDQRKAGIPIIAITANTGKQAHRQFLTEGMNDWVIKPFKEETLYKRIARHIRGKDRLSDTMRKRKFPIRKKPVYGVQPLYDLSMLKKDSPENKAFILRMLTIFIESIPAIVDKMLVHFENAEMDAVSTLAHKIKPTLDSAGIVSLKEAIRNIEGYRDKRRSKDQLEADLKLLKEIIDKVAILFKYEIENLSTDAKN
ncbi:MAG: PAS domain-containing protein [Bacteroidetes bacterium]|nr:PAS domain-containing protein [Bacteroidota bacterium]